MPHLLLGITAFDILATVYYMYIWKNLGDHKVIQLQYIYIGPSVSSQLIDGDHSSALMEFSMVEYKGLPNLRNTLPYP